jgi:hypothetical protein
VRIRHLLAGATVVATVFALAGPAAAAPTGSKNAFQGMADCGSAGSYHFVVNSANGQGKGTQTNNGNQAEWAPAHLLETGQVFHPTAFATIFTLTAPDGTTESFTNNDVRKNQTGNVTCMLSGTQTNPDGSSFSIGGSVTGWIS